jgi:predicted dienelactone hydrolase
VLVAAGGIPDLARIGPYCQVHPDHDLCTAIRHAGLDPSHLPIHAPQNAWISDPRIKAVVVAAPAFGFTFGKGGFAKVRAPVQLWRAEDDQHQPNPYYDEAVREALPGPPEYRVVRGAGHFDFLPPCDAQLAKAVPEICSDKVGFDRVAFHSAFNAAVVQFFRTHL